MTVSGGGTVCGRDEAEKLWRAVDGITKPTRRKIDRDAEAEADLAAELLHDLAYNPTRVVCSILEKQRADRLAADMTSAYGEIPALWDQAEWALTTGSEMQEGGCSPLRERSPADLDLMETMLTIRETLAAQLEGRGQKPKDGPKAQMRQLAAYLVGHGPQQHVEWWTYRIDQWRRLLLTHLNAADHAPKPVRLRNSTCPNCQQRAVVDIRDDGSRLVVPALIIDFTADGYVRAAQCGNCQRAWFRGAEMEKLADMLGCKIA